MSGSEHENPEPQMRSFMMGDYVIDIPEDLVDQVLINNLGFDCEEVCYSAQKQQHQEFQSRGLKLIGQCSDTRRGYLVVSYTVYFSEDYHIRRNSIWKLGIAKICSFN